MMNASVEVLVTFLLYLAFFGWIGWRRGWLAELIVFGAAFLAWIAFQQQGDIFVRIANLGGKFFAFVRAGGLGADPDPAFAALKDAPQWVTAESRPGYLFLLWVVIVLLAYIISSSVQTRPKKNSQAGGWAVLLGMANGILFAITFLPRLVTLLAPEGGDLTQLVERANLLGLLTSSWRLLSETVRVLWGIARPQAPIILLILLTLFLVLSAATLKGGGKSERSSEAKAKS